LVLVRLGARDITKPKLLGFSQGHQAQISHESSVAFA